MMQNNTFGVFLAMALCTFIGIESMTINLSSSMDQQEILSELLNRIHFERFGFNLDKANENECFDAYVTKQEANTKNYRVEYNLCKEKASDARNQLSSQSSQERTEIIARGDDICGDLSDCEVHMDGLEFFKCYNHASSSNSPELYQISVDSNAQFASLKIGYELIESDEENCTTLALVAYVENYHAASRELQECLNSPPETTHPPSSPGSSTEQPSSPGSSTEQPSSPGASTEQPSSPGSSTQSTSSPEASTQSTSSPGSSTEQPSSPGASTEQPSSPGSSTQSTSSPGSSTQSPSSPGSSTEQPSSPGASTEQPSSTGSSTQSTSSPGSSTQSPSSPGSSTEQPSSTESAQSTVEPLPEEDLYWSRIFNKFWKNMKA